MGQEVLSWDPNEVEPTPPPNESVSYWADMEWQCQIPMEFYGSFENQPFHCQMRTMYDQSYQEPENPMHIPDGVDAPIKQQPVPAGNVPTQKPMFEDTLADGVNPGSMIPKASEPDDDGEDEVILIIDEDGEKWDDSIPDFKDASQSGDEKKLNVQEVKKVADDIQAMLDANPNCLSYISDLLDKVETPFNPIVSKNPLDVLWAVFAQGGIFIRDPKSEWAGATATGSIAKTPNWFFEMRYGRKVNLTEHRPAEINIRPDNRIYTNSPWKKGSKSAKIAEQQFNRSKELHLALDVLNEVLHHSRAFVYTDKEFSVALAELHNIPLPNCNSVDCWSRFWHTRFGTIKGENGNTVFCQFTNVK